MRQRSAWIWALGVAIAGSAFAAACGGDGEVVANQGFGGNSASAGAGGASGGAATDGGGGTVVVPDGGDEQTLIVDPPNTTLDVDGTPKTVQLTAKYQDGTPAPAVVWLTDDVTVGSTSDAGLFTAGGWVAGTAKVTARSGELSGSAIVKVRVRVVDDSVGVSAADKAKVEAGGSADSGFKWLYPYDRTIFPRGLAAPSLQFGGSGSDVTRVSITVGDFSYVGWFGPSNPSRVALPQVAWEGVTKSAGPGVEVKVDVSKLRGNGVSGPVSESWKIAQGSLKGVVYYNTYRSPLANGGAVMRIKPGGNAEVLRAGCTVCHSVSAQGNVLVAGVQWTDGATGDEPAGNPEDSASFNLEADGSISERNRSATGRKYSFGGLTPDGSRMLSSAVVGSGPMPRGLSGAIASKLYDTQTGAEVPTTGFAPVQYALTPAFSPSGKKLAFAYGDKGSKALGLFDYDGSGARATFANLREVATSSQVVAWPSFLPDDLGIVFHEGDSFDTATHGGGELYAGLRLVDVASGAVKALEQLNGYDAAGNFYLPYGKAEEENLDYEPSVLPVPVGGYYWVMFTSRRAYGNTIAPGGTVPRGDDKWGELVNGAETPSPRKKIWVAAIDLDWQGKPDPSHPAFYLSGQELEAGNMRAFAALEPCKQNGSSCESGAECCGGFCRQTGTSNGKPVLECVPPPSNSCSNEDEACTTTADCCRADQGYECIAGRCAQPPPT
jgi:hypothetical protein